MAAPVSHWLRLFDFSSETTERNSTKVDRKQDLNILYQVSVFLPISKQKWPPWLIRQKGSTLYSGARYVALWASCFNIVSQRRGSCGVGGFGGPPPEKKLSKTGSFSHKNTQFDT